MFWFCRLPLCTILSDFWPDKLDFITMTDIAALYKIRKSG